jgi:hypothetical protein
MELFGSCWMDTHEILLLCLDTILKELKYARLRVNECCDQGVTTQQTRLQLIQV